MDSHQKMIQDSRRLVASFPKMRFLFINLILLHTLLCFQICSCENSIDSRALNVGVELKKETLPIHSGSRLYHLHGLKPRTWYEVKISYPASIPASFSLELKRDKLSTGLLLNRRLLNTEKIIFNTESLDRSHQDGMFVLVTVEPEGFVAFPNVSEREFVVYNIVCDELVLGIPHKAWAVAILVILCLGFAFIIPSFLPPYLLQSSQSSSKYS